MAKAQPRSSPKQLHWRRLLQRWQHSGLSVRAFCEQAGCSEPSFYAWRRTLAQRDRVAASEPAVTFVPVHVQAEPVASCHVLELVLTDGRLLRIPAGIAPAIVRDLLAVLEETPC